MHPAKLIRTIHNTTAISPAATDQGSRSARALAIWPTVRSRHAKPDVGTEQIGTYMLGLGAASTPNRVGPAGLATSVLPADSTPYRGAATADEAMAAILTNTPNDVREVLVFAAGPAVVIRTDDGAKHRYGRRAAASDPAFVWAGSTLDAIGTEMLHPTQGGWAGDWRTV